MNNERIQEIKRRWQAEMDAFQNHDIAYLLSEVERLQTENKRLIGVLEDVKIYVPHSDTPAKDAVKIVDTVLSHLKG